jgi:hypothetical protein
MTGAVKKTMPPATLSLRHAFDVEQAKREAERYAREEAARLQQEQDLHSAEQLYDALISDPDFLRDHGLTVDWRRYSVHLENADFRIRSYFEAGRATITVGDKRNVAVASSPAPLKSEQAESVAEALQVVASFLADEIHS